MKIAIVTFPGSAGDLDIQEALLSVGVKQNDIEIIDEKETDLTRFDGVFLPGGASYGDSIRPGAIARVMPVAEAVVAYAKAGKPLVGIGNGFQILTELGLLPGGFLKNKALKSVNGLVDVEVINSHTVFTNQSQVGQMLKLPLSHLFGQYTVDAETLANMKANNQIVLTYASMNPNGSVENIAAVTNETGTVVGMMLKPERAMDSLLGSNDGQAFFQSFSHQMTLG